MSSPSHALLTGSFVSDGNIRNISLPSGYDDFRLINISDIGSSASNTNVMLAEGTSLMLAGSAYYTPKTSGAATLGTTSTTLTGGFTFVSSTASASNGGSVAISAITAANPAVVSATTTGLVAGSSVVRIFNETSMQQIASMDFTVGTISAGVSFQLKYLDASGFAAAGTTGSYRIIPYDAVYYPRRRYITKITQASSAVITLSVTHGYTVGQAIRVILPAAFGMTEINGLIGNITAVDLTNNTITVDINSTGFTAFAFPTSAVAAAGVSFAEVTPVGEAAINSVSQPYGNLLDDATRNLDFTGVQIGGTVQTSGVTYQWLARKGNSI